MPFPKGAMVEVINDVTPWYGQVESYFGGAYTIRIGGSDMTVDVAEGFVKFHPAMQEAQKVRMRNFADKMGELKPGAGPPRLIGGSHDILGKTTNNRLADTIIDNPSGGTILTVCNGNALLTLMWPSTTHVIVVDVDEGRISSLNTLIALAEQSNSLVEWYCRVYQHYGRMVLDNWIFKYRPHSQNFLALKRCRPRVHLLTQNLAAPDAIESMTAACGCDCIRRITNMYVSCIENYIQPDSPYNPGIGPDALPNYQRNVLGLMQENTLLIRGRIVKMEVNRGKAAVKRAWNLT